MSGRYLEDFAVGQTFASGRLSVEAAEMILPVRKKMRFSTVPSSITRVQSAARPIVMADVPSVMVAS